MREVMLDEEYAAIRERAAGPCELRVYSRFSGSPWERCDRARGILTNSEYVEVVSSTDIEMHAREDILALLAEVERLRSRLSVSSALSHYVRQFWPPRKWYKGKG